MIVVKEQPAQKIRSLPEIYDNWTIERIRHEKSELKTKSWNHIVSVHKPQGTANPAGFSTCSDCLQFSSKLYDITLVLEAVSNLKPETVLQKTS